MAHLTPEWIARALLALYLLLIVAVIVVRAARHPYGWRAWVIFAVGKAYIRICFHWRSNRRCPFPKTGPALIIANHRSPIDPLFVVTGVEDDQPVSFMMAREYYEPPGLHFICSGMESIPVDRDGQDLAATRAALRRLKDGKMLGIFPEGKININAGPGLLPGNPGVAWLAMKSRAPVYPVFVHNAPLGTTMIAPFYSFRRVSVTYGEPIDLSAYYNREFSNELLREVTDLMMSRLAALEGGDTATPLRESPADRETIRLAASE